jgi:hypothetical protein
MSAKHFLVGQAFLSNCEEGSSRTLGERSECFAF